MKRPLTILASLLTVALATQCVPNDTSKVAYDKAVELGMPEGNKLSAAMKRAVEWPERDNTWFIEYKTMPLKGDLAYEEGVVRFNLVQ